MSVKTVLAKDQEDDDDYSPGLEDVYGSKRVMQKLRGMHSRPGWMIFELRLFYFITVLNEEKTRFK